MFFPQEHLPGREAAYDFTNCDELGVTIGGAPFEHLLFELVLSFSGWRWATVASSESYEALLLGVQEALWRLGGVVEVLRSDNLSAATHELPVSGGRALTRRYQSLLDHYGLKSTRIFPRKAHENGVVEQAHRRTKSILAQTLVLRGSHDFPSVDEYQRWVREVIEREHNALRGEKLIEERRHLRPLPVIALPAYTTFTVRVRRWSTIRVVNHTYSVAGAINRRTSPSPSPSRSTRSVLRGQAGGAAAAAARAALGADRLSSRHLVAGAQARRLCPLPLARGVVPESRLPARLRCAARLPRRAGRSRVRANPASGGG